jgi:glucose-1-phosphate thymidylyltransferase
MKGVILAGGLGTRLSPLTLATNKHLLPVYNKPMIFYPIETLLKAGIKEILIVTGGPHAGHFIRVLKNGKELGIKHLEYTYQEKPDGGIADALALADDFADGSPITVVLGDNCMDIDIKKELKNFKKGALVFLKKVTDPERYGVPRFDKKGKIIEFIEKPKNPPSDFAGIGVYVYDNTVFAKIKTLKPSERGQLEVTDLINCYIKEGTLRWGEAKGFWSDAGTFDSLYDVNKYWAQKRR